MPQPIQITAIFAAIIRSYKLLIYSKFLWSLPMVMFHVAVGKRKIASLIMPVGRQLSLFLHGLKNRKNAVVDTLLILVDVNESLGRGWVPIYNPS